MSSNTEPATSTRPTAIIVGAEPRVVVTIARSLHSRGVRCVVAIPAGQSLRVSSRAISAAVNLEGSIADSAVLLRHVADSEHASWIAPTSDGALAVIGYAYEELSRICAIGCPPPNIVERVLDKSQTLTAALRCGVPVPRSVTINSPEELSITLAPLRFPLVVKPADKGVKSAHDFKTRTFTTDAELRQAFQANPAFGAGLLFQEYHAGNGVGVEVLMHQGVPVAHFQHRRLSELPPSGGVAVAAVSEPPDPMLLDYSVRLLRELEWEGVAMVEFRHDPATRATALMEVNGRFWGSIALPVAAGMDFPFYAWQIAQGVQPTPPDSYKLGLRIRWTAGALQRFAHPEHASGSSAAPGPMRQLFADFRPGTRSAMWSRSDPGPALQEVAALLGRMLKDSVRSVVSAAVPRSVIETVRSARDLPSGRRGHYVRRQMARSLRIAPRQRLPAEVKSVLFVCHGNIMRSAAAAQFLKDALQAAGTDHIQVSSAGTTTRAGRMADHRVSNAARSFGTSLEEHRSQPLTDQLVEQADVIFAMDDLNFVNIASAFPRSRHKLMLFGGMTPDGEYAPVEIVDPYTATEEDVHRTVARVHGYVDALSRALSRRQPV